MGNRENIQEGAQQHDPDYINRFLIEEATVATALYVGPEVRIAYVNDIMLSYWGKDRSVVGKTILEALPEIHDQPFPALLSQVYTTGVSYESKEDMANLMVDGALKTGYYTFTYKPLRNKDGAVWAIHHMALDITDQVLTRKKIEEAVAERTKELLESNLLLQQSNNELNQLTYVASHDLQEPLRKIRTFASFLVDELGQVSEKAQSYLDKIDGSIQRMQALISDVLAFSLLANQTEQFKPVNLNQVAQDVLGNFKPLIKEKKAVITVDELPVIEAIPLELKQLFAHLLSNALKFTEENTPPAIRIRSRKLSTEEVGKHDDLDKGRAYHEIQVGDRGIGFEQQYADKIFVMFQRLHSPAVYEGTGIGLALCKKIVLKHKGLIYAASQPAVGTSIFLILPETQ
ncbi:MAG: PAS domain-containing protein [Williamsia sp.]|nr:PAS domain-containing protein [Williamsia sp.]